MNRKVVLGVLLSLMLAVFASGASAAGSVWGTCANPVSLDGVVVCFLGNVDNQDGTTTWTYAITPDVGYTDESLSHLDFEVCPSATGEGYDVVSPTELSGYSTIDSYSDFVGRSGVPYDVKFGKDPSIPGHTTDNLIKFTQTDTTVFPKLSGSDVDIFQYTQLTQANPGVTLVELAVKTGRDGAIGQIEGPVCGGTTAVNLVEFNASTGLFARLLSFFGLR